MLDVFVESHGSFRRLNSPVNWGHDYKRKMWLKIISLHCAQSVELLYSQLSSSRRQIKHVGTDVCAANINCLFFCFSTLNLSLGIRLRNKPVVWLIESTGICLFCHRKGVSRASPVSCISFQSHWPKKTSDIIKTLRIFIVSSWCHFKGFYS